MSDIGQGTAIPRDPAFLGQNAPNATKMPRCKVIHTHVLGILCLGEAATVDTGVHVGVNP